ncbi:hypothetical protein ACFQJ7_03210 [Halovenus rubra]|uniref:Uncharacterized protein n=2 Tax=Halovenus rubra TaxID=869890 RepID=A0ACC7E2L3_9EURY|nr:hypothetical protein [Halovenus rubra]
MNRCEVLGVSSTAAFIGLAGCLGSLGETDKRIHGIVRPDNNPRTVPSSFQCTDDEFERYWVNRLGVKPRGTRLVYM